MRLIISLLVIAYLVGVGVTLGPTFKANWSTVPASQLVEKVVADLPQALSWPVAAYRSFAQKPGAPDKPSAPDKPGAAQ
jgi:hypothetical protein